MRETLGVTSGLLALLFAVGAFSLLLLGTPPERSASWEGAERSHVESPRPVAAPLWSRTGASADRRGAPDLP